MIAAILRAQLLSMRIRRGTGPGAAVFGMVTGLLFYSFWSFLAWTAMLFFSLPDQTPLFVPALSWVLMFIMLYWQLAPVISASFGASLDLRKLLAYPIPHNKLFLVEVLLRITTCLEMLILLAGPMAGLLQNPRIGWQAAPGIIGAGVAFAAVNVLLSAGARNWLERVFLKTRLKEAMMLLVVFGALAPQFLLLLHVRKESAFQFAPSQIVWPWAALAHVMLHDSPGLSLLSAAVWIGIATWFSRWQFERSIRYDGASVRRSAAETSAQARPDGLTDRIFRLPSRFLPDPLAAMVEKELRTLARIPRFRLIYIMSCSFGLVLYFPSLRRGQSHDTFFMQNALPMMSLYGLLMLGQITYWNAFGFDRSAVQGYFSWPVKFRHVLIAKNLSVVSLLLPQILLISVICKAAKIPVSAGKVVETIVVMAIASLYWFALGNIFSVRIPRALDPDKMNQMANKMQAATIFTAPFVLFPLALAYWSRWFFSSQIVFTALLLVAAIVGGIFYWVGLDSAVSTAWLKREQMLQKLSRSDGPLSVT
jgi:ABC-2 type transport system permease protein